MNELQKMLQKQEELNNLTFPEWKTKLNPYDWDTAMLVESGECLDSLAYKWWKKQDVDLDNVKVELIDILHFLLSKALYFDIDFDDLYEKIKSVNLMCFYLNPNEKILKNIKYDILVLNKETIIEEQFLILFSIFGKLEMKIEDIFRAYMVKNVLNQFRQDFGYKIGDYIKVWDFKNNLEDNVVAYDLALNIKDIQNFDKILYNKLKDYYLSKVKKD